MVRRGWRDMDNAKRLAWKCRRGMKELDDLLVAYLERHYPAADAATRRSFEALLDREDPELVALIFGKADPEDADTRNVIGTIRQLSPR